MDASSFPTLPQLFAAGRARHVAPSVIDVVGGRTYSSMGLWREVARTIDALNELGVRAGDRVLVQCEKSVGVLVTYLACVHHGSVFLPLNTAYTDAEAQWIVDDATPALVIGDPSRATLGGAHRSLALSASGVGSWTDAVAGSRGGPGEEAVFGATDRRGEDLAALLYTSGTTGRPKGAMLTQRNLASNAGVLAELWGVNPTDRLLHMLPIFHAHGLFVAVNTVLASGASMVWLPRFDIDTVFTSLPNATVVMGVPTHYTRMLADPRLTSESSARVRLFISGSAPLLQSTHEAFEARTGHRIVERYGMTETVMLTSNPLNGDRRAGTVGPALPGVEVRIVDDEGQTMGVGDVGSVEVHGPNVFSGYWNRQDLNSTEFAPDGFFRTGDVGMLDAERYLWLIGRSKDLIISGGLNVYPIEVEEVLDAFPGVAESAVIGVPDPDFGEAVTAVVVAESGDSFDTESLRAAARERLAIFKVPKRFHIVDALPRNAMGKVEKAKLRAMFGGTEGEVRD